MNDLASAAAEHHMCSGPVNAHLAAEKRCSATTNNGEGMKMHKWDAGARERQTQDGEASEREEGASERRAQVGDSFESEAAARERWTKARG
eukprot:6148960-Pleurochrysis_carterae.AAC.3